MEKQFPADIPFSDTQYTYDPGYFLVSGWSLLLGLLVNSISESWTV